MGVGTGYGRRVVAAVASAVVAATLVLVPGGSVRAAFYCGLDEFDQNVFSVNNGLWSNPANWSRNHIPTSGEAVCVPGGIVARVSSATTGLLGAHDGYITTLRVEGTIRIESGTTVSLATAIYGGSNLFNGGVIQVVNGSSFDMNADQNGAPAFQNVIGGSRIQVAGGSRLLVRRPLLNAGTIDLTGGGEMLLDSPASAYSGDGSVVGGQMRMNAGTLTFGGPGSFSALATNGNIRGTITSGQSLDLACQTSSGGVNLSAGLTNNGAIHFLPPLAGDCSEEYTLPGGATLTNNGTITFGNPGVTHTFNPWGSNPYSYGGLIENTATGTITVHDRWGNLGELRNAGTFHIAPGGFYQDAYYPVVNTGTFVNDGLCDVFSLDSPGTLELSEPCGIRTKLTLSASSVLRTQWSDAELAKVTVGQPSPIGGTVEVVTDGAVPAPGTTRDLIEGPVSGTFAAVTSQSPQVGYSAIYGDGGNGVQLQAGAGVAPIEAVVPARLLDTRSAGATVDGVGQGGGQAGAGSTVEMLVAGRGGVPGDASAVVLNVTVTEAEAPGFVTVYPCGAERPLASSLNYAAGSTVPNGVIAKVGAGGKVCLYTSAGTHLIADVNGYFAADAAYAPLVPGRLLDSRSTGATVDGVAQSGGLAGAGTTIELLVAGRGGVPGDASAVVLNVTVTEAEAPGFVTVYPCGAERPLASSLNYAAGSTVPNGVIAKVGAGSKVCLYTSAGTHLIADVNGYFRGDSGFTPATPARLLDSRSAGATVDGVAQSGGSTGSGTTIELPVAGRGGVPGDASAVVLNVTVTEAEAPGFVTVYPCGAERPLASSLNYGAGSTVPNGVIAKVGAGGKVCLYTSAGTHLIADLNGWFTGA